MQEVDFLEEFGCPLREYGYDWVLVKKSRNGHGLAVLFKTSRLKIKEYQTIKYDEINNFNSCFVTLETGNMAQIMSFEIIGTNTTIIVSNTHLYWRPEASSIKIKQVWTLIESLFKFKGNSNSTVLMCGDWNIIPQDILYRLLTRKETVSEYELMHVFVNTMDHGTENHPAACEKILEFLPIVPRLTSAYKEFHGNEPPFTTTSNDFTGVLDYIFIWGSGLKLIWVERIMEMGHIPNSNFPSDHVPVVATFSNSSFL